MIGWCLCHVILWEPSLEGWVKLHCWTRTPPARHPPPPPARTLPGARELPVPPAHLLPATGSPHGPQAARSRGAGTAVGRRGRRARVGDGKGSCPFTLQALTQVSTSQASLIWQELEAEEQEELPAAPWQARDPRVRAQVATLPEHADEGCVRYFVLGTMAAIVAFFLNIFYPLLYQPRWR